MSNLEQPMGRRQFLRRTGEAGLITAAVLWLPTQERGESLYIPSDYLKWYEQYGEEFWTVLASIGKQESKDGRSDRPGVKSGLNDAGCCVGPMQFNVMNKPVSTWKAYGKAYQGHETPDPNRVPNPYDPKDAIPSARDLLLDLGVRKNPWKAADEYSGNIPGYANSIIRRAIAYQRKYPEKPTMTLWEKS